MRTRSISKEMVRASMDRIVREACAQWNELRERLRKGESLFLYYRHPASRNRIGRLKVANADPKRGWMLACNLGMPASWSEEQAEAFIYEQMIRLPILKGPFK